jgi:hypothetical protein
MAHIVEANLKKEHDRAALCELIAHLRQTDIDELNAVRGDFGASRLWFDLSRSEARMWFAYPKQFRFTPAAAFGFHRMTPTCAGVFAFGTDDWPLVVKGMTRRILRDIMPMAPMWGLHRAECRALASRQDVRRWLEGLGWRAEAVLSEFGIRREDFILYAWTAPHEAHPHKQGEHQGFRELSACDA